jgi:Uncharacterized protein conserved in bacteria (DUF2188)
MIRKSLGTKKGDVAKKQSDKERIASRNLHVLPRDNEWVIMSEGDPKKASSVHNTQSGAIEVARKLAKESEGQLVIHARSGRIRAREYYWKEIDLQSEPRQVMKPGSRPVSASVKEIRSAVGSAVAQSTPGPDNNTGAGL